MIFKRLLDIGASILMLILTSPILLITAVLIKLTSKGGALFKQERKGQNGKNFTIVKFRTMYIDNNDQTLTQVNDKRITPIGNFLRKTRIDEIPQLINVLKGDMSLVGPRPERVEYAEELESKIPMYRKRYLVKPGITGWDQISGEYHSPTLEDTKKKLEYDLYYVKNISFWLDLRFSLKRL